MKYYTTTPPSLDGIIADDPMYFEGIERPQALYMLRDGHVASPDSLELLEKYFHDLHTLFLRKLSAFVAFDKVGEEDSLKIQALLQELIKVKELIEKGEKEGK